MHFEPARDTKGAGEVVETSVTSGTAEEPAQKAGLKENPSALKPPFPCSCTGCQALPHPAMYHDTSVRQQQKPALQPGEAHDSADSPSPLLPSLPAGMSDGTPSYRTTSPDNGRIRCNADYAERSELERAFFNPTRRTQEAPMETQQCHLPGPDRLDDHASQWWTYRPEEQQGLYSENELNANEQGPVSEEEKMDDQEIDVVLRCWDAGDYFEDPEPGMSRLTTLLAAQEAQELLEQKSQQVLTEYNSSHPVLLKTVVPTGSSEELLEAFEKPAASDAGHSWRQSSEQAKQEPLLEDSGDAVQDMMSKLEDLKMEPKCPGCEQDVTAREHLCVDSADVLLPMARQVEDMRMNPLPAGMTIPQDELKCTDSLSPML